MKLLLSWLGFVVVCGGIGLWAFSGASDVPDATDGKLPQPIPPEPIPTQSMPTEAMAGDEPDTQVVWSEGKPRTVATGSNVVIYPQEKANRFAGIELIAPGRVIVRNAQTKQPTPLTNRTLQTFEAMAGNYEGVYVPNDATLPLEWIWIELGGDDPPPPPPDKLEIRSFEANPTTIKKGESSTLSWSVAPSTASVTLDGLLVSVSGSRSVSPQTTTKYQLAAVLNSQAESKTATVTVEGEPPPPGDCYVLIVEEQQDREKITAGQKDVLLASDPGSVRAWLEENCPDEFRIVDVPSDNRDPFELDDESWQEVWDFYKEKHAGQTPWLIATDGGDNHYDGPLPDGREATLKVLQGVAR